MPYANIGGLTWREGTEPTLVLLYRWRTFARRLIVPEPYYGQAARRCCATRSPRTTFTSRARRSISGMHDERDDV